LIKEDKNFLDDLYYIDNVKIMPKIGIMIPMAVIGWPSSGAYNSIPVIKMDMYHIHGWKIASQMLLLTGKIM
jgi:hypothetical protein